jgi:para-nitrobenzyl esterase
MQNHRRRRFVFGAGTREAHACLQWKAGRIAGSLVASCLIGFLLCTPVPAADVRNPVVQPGACTGSAEVVCTETGAVQGTVTGGVRAFKGIPYAKPPVGALRFRPPQPAQAWQGTLAGDRFGPVCPQLAPGNKVVGSEECLLVNVWTPAQRPDKLLPVMIWLHGGGNAGLSGAGTASYGGVVYDGSLMVERGGVVFVTYNLRLGVLGFLAHPALDAERPEKISGNYGSLDQIAMLQWVRNNIRNFGGDPDRVFLFGTSAGGGNICALMTSPLAQNLFHGVAMQSSVPTSCELQTLADAQQRTGTRVAAAAGCTNASDVAACLRAKSVEEIVGAVPGGTNIHARVYGPNVDGHVFPEQPAKLIAARRYKPLPVIIGNTADETKTFLNVMGPVADPAAYAEAVAKLFGDKSRDAILARYPAANFASPRAALEAATTDAYFTCTTRRVARLLTAAQTAPVYTYYFTHVLENDEQERARGASHTVEHPFFFAWSGKYRPSDGERKLQNAMTLYWSRMAVAGDPNGGGNPAWPRYEAQTDAHLELAAQPRAGNALKKEQCDFWDTVTLPWPHL